MSEAVAAGIDPADLHLLVAAEMANLLGADGGRVVRYVDDVTVEVPGAWRRASLPQTRSGELVEMSRTWAVAQVRATGTTSISELAVANADARARSTVQATTDGPTGLANHGTFHTALADEFARTSRYGRPPASR